MATKLNAQQFRPMEVDFDYLIETISTGNAVLFVGSGFARNAIGLNNSAMPTASGLAADIGKLGNFDADDDLRYASEKFLRENEAEALVEYLKDAFTVKNCLPHQTTISSAPWRRIYTTNYDMCIEESAKLNGKRIETVGIDDTPSDYLNNKNICVHLNGSLKNLTAEALGSSFKLSNSSYLSPESFLTSAWHYPFKRDLEMCSALVFVGYSLYDIEIQKILYENEEFSKKTFFITSPTIKERERFTIAPFGHCIPIGAEGFSDKIAEKLPAFLSDIKVEPITSLTEYKKNEKDEIPRDADVEKFLLYGDLKNSLMERALSSDDGAPLLIRRNDLNQALEAALAGRHIAILSDFGNGKTIFLRSLSFLLAQKGFAVYLAENNDFYNHRDLEILSKSSKRTYLIVDSYDQYLDFLRHFSEINPSNIILVLATRTPRHDRARDDLSRLKIFPDEFLIDELSDSEISRFVNILGNIGFWDEGGIALPENEKIKYIKIKNKAQLQQSLFSILQAPQMRSRINEITKSLWAKNTFKNTVFAISVLSAFDFPLKPSIISEVAGTDDIYNSSLRSNEGFKNLFNIERGEIRSRSSVFSLALIRNHFEHTYVVNEILAIAKRMDEHASENSQHRLILKAVLRFSGVESLFPERQRINNLVKYYEEVKRKIPWLQKDPHYWLQYGMALLAYDDYAKAQRMIDSAYKFAETRNNYHTVHIDMVQSRLFMEMATKEHLATESFKLFGKAIDVLRSVPDDDKKYRYLDKIGELFTARFDSYSKGHKNEFIRTCELLIRDIQSYMDKTIPKGNMERRLTSIKEKIDGVITLGKEIVGANGSAGKA